MQALELFADGRPALADGGLDQANEEYGAPAQQDSTNGVPGAAVVQGGVRSRWSGGEQAGSMLPAEEVAAFVYLMVSQCVGGASPGLFRVPEEASGSILRR
ncbi:MAG TPA: hypothetical protein VL551_24300 [Actinospica sp.]|nr:hypothetical protein [Actinospica sp.]